MAIQSVTALLVNNIAFCCVNGLLLLTIIWITYKIINEYKKAPAMHIMFLSTMLFNVTAFFCIFASSFKAYTDIANTTFSVDHPIFFPCNLVFLQNTLLVMLLFLRVYYVFHGTPFQLSQITILSFIVSFIISISIFIILLCTSYKIPNTHTSFTCAVTLCVFNLFFMISITTLFLHKLAKIFKIENKDTRNQQDGLINVITKMTILSSMSMTITFIACLFLLFRFTVFGNNCYTIIISEWTTTVDTYSNFICLSLTFNFFEGLYFNICTSVHGKCKTLWYIVLIGNKNEEKLADVISRRNSDKTTTETNSDKGTADTNPKRTVKNSEIIVEIQKSGKSEDTPKTPFMQATDYNSAYKVDVQKSEKIEEAPNTPFLQLVDYSSAYKVKNQLSKSKLVSDPPYQSS